MKKKMTVCVVLVGGDLGRRRRDAVRDAFGVFGFTLYRTEDPTSWPLMAMGDVEVNGGRRQVETELEGLSDRFPNLVFRISSIRADSTGEIRNPVGPTADGMGRMMALDPGEGHGEPAPTQADQHMLDSGEGGKVDTTVGDPPPSGNETVRTAAGGDPMAGC